MSKVEKNFQDVALDYASKRFAKMLGIDNVPIVWNSNPYRVAKPDGNAARSYPIVYMKTGRFGRVESSAYKKHPNTYQYGAIGTSGERRGFKLIPIQVDLNFFLVTDNYQQAVSWATELLFARENHEDNAALSFAITSKDSLGFRIPNQMFLISDAYDIQEVEYDESTPMEYRIEGALTLMTRASKGGMTPELLATFQVLTSTDVDNAVMNQDGSTDSLLRNSIGEPLPIRLRSNLD